MQMKTSAVSAVVLTGGKSSRMGRSKALLPFNGEPLISHVVRQLKTVFHRIIVVAAPAQELPDLDATLVRDEVAYQGPVGGIYFGLRAADPEIAFVTSCDAPFLNLALICHLVSRMDGFDVVVPFWQERLQPLHAVYHPRVVPVLKEQLERHELRPIFLYEKVPTLKISEQEIRVIDPDGSSFINMNMPADYQAAVQRWQDLHPPADTGIFCSVELFGVARLLAKTSKLDLGIPARANLAHVIAALAEKLPVLAGKVIEPSTKSLIPGYACNVNGLEFVRDPNFEIKHGDSVFILSADAGG